jgi:hypothetical protein
LFVWVRVVGLFVSFVVTNLSQGLIITRVTMVFGLQRVYFDLCILLRDIAHTVFLLLLVCKEPPCDGVEAQ